MGKLKSKLNPEEVSRSARGFPTKHKTDQNVHELRCGECGETYYVDDHLHAKVTAAYQENPHDNPFVCIDCEEAYSEEAHGH